MLLSVLKKGGECARYGGRESTVTLDIILLTVHPK